ncbi:hypothetical protein [Mesorhizobium caraganae]|uniref:hypothetical protein n=1 Tax=Mesorhizobium caraganae TaxID=483206 RepID=UPI003ECE51A3
MAKLLRDAVSTENGQSPFRFRALPEELSGRAHGNFAGLAEIETEPRPSDIGTKHM